MEFTQAQVIEALLFVVQDALLDNLDPKSNVMNQRWNDQLSQAQDWLWELQEESE